MPTCLESKWTYDDYLLFPEDGRHHEILDGKLYVTPSPHTKHQRVSRNLLLALASFLKQSSLGEVYDAPFDVVLSETDVVQPDLLVILTERLGIVTEKNVQGAPDLLIEIVSETTRRTDEIVKRKLYERRGVRECWIVDPRDRDGEDLPPERGSFRPAGDSLQRGGRCARHASPPRPLHSPRWAVRVAGLEKPPLPEDMGPILRIRH